MTEEKKPAPKTKKDEEAKPEQADSKQLSENELDKVAGGVIVHSDPCEGGEIA